MVSLMRISEKREEEDQEEVCSCRGMEVKANSSEVRESFVVVGGDVLFFFKEKE